MTSFSHIQRTHSNLSFTAYANSPFGQNNEISSYFRVFLQQFKVLIVIFVWSDSAYLLFQKHLIHKISSQNGQFYFDRCVSPLWVIAECTSLRCKVAVVTKFCMVLCNIFGLQYGTSFMSPFWWQKFNVTPLGYSFPFLVQICSAVCIKLTENISWK